MKKEKTLNCPLCLKSFNTIVINKSSLKVKIRESDFHIIYHDYSPLLYEAIVCSNCGFAGLRDQFEEVSISNKKFLRNYYNKKKILPIPKINDFINRNYEDAEMAFNQAVNWGKILKTSSFKIAGIILRAAWLCREQGDEKKEKNYLGKAILYYEKAYSSERIINSPLGEPGAAYIAGELYRRLGENNKAFIWFNSAIRSQNIKKHPLINKLSRQQLFIIRDISESKQNEQEIHYK